MEDFLANSFAPEFRPVDDGQRLKDNLKAIKKGNNKSALDNVAILRNQVLSKIYMGFKFPFDPSAINLIKNSIVVHYCMAIQHTFNKSKQKLLKYRPTHDLTIKQSPNNSINHRLLRES